MIPGSNTGAGPGMNPLTLGITRKGVPIQRRSLTNTVGAGAGIPAAATAFWTAA